MTFEAVLTTDGGVATITLSGELDTNAAPDFRARVEEAAATSPTRLVLLTDALTYLSSAGLRSLVFARQKMGADVDLYVVGAQEAVAETIKLTGFDHSIIMQEAYAG